MSSIAIIGAGQAGLQLGIGLLKKTNHSVAIFTNKSSTQVANGTIMSSQGMFHSSLILERELQIDFWENEAPQNNAVTFTLVDPENHKQILQWQGKTKHSYQSIDQRLKFPRWMTEFEKLGGKIVIEDIGFKELDDISRRHDLTVVSSGKGEVSQSFTRNDDLSIFSQPQRALSCIYVNNVNAEKKPGVRAYIIPGIGEFFIMPGLTLSGPCEMMLFEGLPGGSFDCWKSVKSIDEQFDIAINLLKKYVPYEAERCINSKPTDRNAGLTGSYTPVVRYPSLQMPCGKLILGIGDVVVLNDPIAGQGANNAAKAANLYLKRILENKNNNFSREWMEETFKLYWDNYAKSGTEWTTLLLSPPKTHVMELLAAASRHNKIADMLANGFDNPSSLFPWIQNHDETEKIIKKIENDSISSEVDNNESLLWA